MMREHSKTELLTSRRNKGESVHGPHHDGGPKPGHYAAKGEPGLLVHPHSVPNAAGMEAVTSVKATLGKEPKPKRAFTEAGPPIHAGMEVQTHGGAAFGGDHRSAVDALTGLSVVPDKSGKAATAHPLTKIAPTKNLKPVEFSPGMRLRNRDKLASGEPGAAHDAFTDERRAALHELGKRVMQDALDHERQPFGPKRGKFAPLPPEVQAQQTISDDYAARRKAGLKRADCK